MEHVRDTKPPTHGFELKDVTPLFYPNAKVDICGLGHEYFKRVADMWGAGERPDLNDLQALTQGWDAVELVDVTRVLYHKILSLPLETDAEIPLDPVLDKIAALTPVLEKITTADDASMNALAQALPVGGKIRCSSSRRRRWQILETESGKDRQIGSISAKPSKHQITIEAEGHEIVLPCVENEGVITGYMNQECISQAGICLHHQFQAGDVFSTKTFVMIREDDDKPSFGIYLQRAQRGLPSQLNVFSSGGLIGSFIKLSDVVPTA